METMYITGSDSLAIQILKLKTEKSAQEAEFNQSINDLKQFLFNPAIPEKDSLYEKNDKKREFIDLTKIVLNRVTDFSIEQTFGRRRKFRDFLISTMLELASTPIISRNIAALFAGMNMRFFTSKEIND